MTALRRVTVDPRWPIGAAAVATVAVAGWTSRGDWSQLRGQTLLAVVLFFLAIAVGETTRLTILTGRDTSPMSTAAALGLALSALLVSDDHHAGAGLVVTVVSAGILAGALLLTAARARVSWTDLSARVAGASVAPLLYRTLPVDGHTLVQWQDMWVSHRWLVGLVMLVVGGVAMLVDLVLEAAVRAGRDQAPLVPAVVDEVRSTLALGTALVTSGALIALADYAIGVAALPLFLFPLVLTSFAVQRYAGIRLTYRQTIGALSGLTERAGYTAENHGQRVAQLSLAIGRDLGMGQRELTDLEYAALLHDLGQVALREPIPMGATVLVAPSDQQRIAHDGAEIVRTTGVLDNVAAILEAQTTPYRQVREFGQDLPLASRIIKVANAYDDLSGPSRENDERAMERIHLGLGYEYDPRVVDSLTKILDRQRRSSPAAA